MTATLSITAIDREIDEISKHLRRRGVFLRLGRNFHDLQNHIMEQPERASLHSQFDPSGDMDGATSAFWVCGFDPGGELIHTQALQLHDLAGRSVSDHIHRTLPNYLPKSPAVVEASAKASPGPKVGKLRGRVAYHGEMWLKDYLRDKATAAIFNRLGMYLAVREWDPDSIFGLMNWLLACNGFNSRIGYMHTETMTISWDRKADKKQHQVWAVFMEREDINFLLDLPAVEFSSYLHSNFK